MTDDKPAGRLSLYRLRTLPKWLQALVLASLCGPLAGFLMAAWIGLLLLLSRNPSNQISANAALNMVIVLFVSLIGLPLMHRGQYRLFWAQAKSRARLISESGTDLAQIPPPPRIAWSSALRVRHAAMYLIGIAILIGTFAPFGHQAMIAHLLDRFSAGSASRGSLEALVFDYLPFALFCISAGWLIDRQLRRRDAGDLDDNQALEVEAEANWLFSFGAAFLVASFLCRWAGSMILAVL